MGAEWVLYVLMFLSLISVALIFQKAFFFRAANRDLAVFRNKIRKHVDQGEWDQAHKLALNRMAENKDTAPDFESALIQDLLAAKTSKTNGSSLNPDLLAELAQDSIIRTKIEWEKNLAVLATIGNNAPFIGLFGTVIGIIQAFHHLSEQATSGIQTVMTGVSEALVATAIGILVAVPAVAAFNLFQRKVRSALNEAEALKSFLIAKIGDT